MAIIEHIESFETQLEQGLGRVYQGGLFSLPEELRLRVGVCGVASIAVQEVVAAEGIASQLILSKPQLPVDPTMDHVFVLTEDDTVVDAAYSMFIQYAGVIPYDVMRGDADDIYPVRKVEQFQLGNSGRVVHELVQSAKRALTFRQIFDEYDRRNFSEPGFKGLSDEEMSDMLARIWNPDFFTTYEPTERTLEAGKMLAREVLSTQARLVA